MKPSVAVFTAANSYSRPRPDAGIPVLFKFTAEYSVLETGERLNFYVVVPCGRSVVSHDWDKINPALGLRNGWLPWYSGQVKVTSKHHLLLVGVPNGCAHAVPAERRINLPTSPLVPRVRYLPNPTLRAPGGQHKRVHARLARYKQGAWSCVGADLSCVRPATSKLRTIGLCALFGPSLS